VKSRKKLIRPSSGKVRILGLKHDSRLSLLKLLGPERGEQGGNGLWRAGNLAAHGRGFFDSVSMRGILTCKHEENK